MNATLVIAAVIAVAVVQVAGEQPFSPLFVSLLFFEVGLARPYRGRPCAKLGKLGPVVLVLNSAF